MSSSQDFVHLAMTCYAQTTSCRRKSLIAASRSLFASSHVGCLRVEPRVHLWNSDHFLVPLLDRRYVQHSVSVLQLTCLHSLLGSVQHRNLPLDHDGDVNNFVDELQLWHLDGFLLNPRSCLDRRCHNVDQAVCSLAVLTFQRASLVLASNVPHDDT